MPQGTTRGEKSVRIGGDALNMAEHRGSVTQRLARDAVFVDNGELVVGGGRRSAPLARGRSDAHAPGSHAEVLLMWHWPSAHSSTSGGAARRLRCRVEDDLAGTVVGSLAATLGAMHNGRAEHRGVVRVELEVMRGVHAPPRAEGDHRSGAARAPRARRTRRAVRERVEARLRRWTTTAGHHRGGAPGANLCSMRTLQVDHRRAGVGVVVRAGRARDDDDDRGRRRDDLGAGSTARWWRRAMIAAARQDRRARASRWIRSTSCLRCACLDGGAPRSPMSALESCARCSRIARRVRCCACRRRPPTRGPTCRWTTPPPCACSSVGARREWLVSVRSDAVADVLANCASASVSIEPTEDAALALPE